MPILDELELAVRNAIITYQQLAGGMAALLVNKPHRAKNIKKLYEILDKKLVKPIQLKKELEEYIKQINGLFLQIFSIFDRSKLRAGIEAVLNNPHFSDQRLIEVELNEYHEIKEKDLQRKQESNNSNNRSQPINIRSDEEFDLLDQEFLDLRNSHNSASVEKLDLLIKLSRAGKPLQTEVTRTHKLSMNSQNHQYNEVSNPRL